MGFLLMVGVVAAELEHAARLTINMPITSTARRRTAVVNESVNISHAG